MAYDIPGPKSLELLKKGPAFLQGGAKYGADAARAAQSGFPPPPQFVIGEAVGSLVIDLDGNKYIDFHAGWASNPFGNANPEVLEVVYKALKRWGFCYQHPLQYELAEKLAEVSPNKKLRRTTFEISGTEAAEAAVSKAIVYTGRPLIITFEDAYHGDSIGARTLGAIGANRKRGFEAWRGAVLHVPYPHSYNVPAGLTPEAYADYIIWYIEEFLCAKIAAPDRIAGIFVEPCMAEGGNWIPTDNFITGLRSLADKYGWLLIVDEVLTGCGRTGKMWAIEHWPVDVDLLVMGKHITGGIEPIAAVQGTTKVMGKTQAYSGSTFAGSPAGCAAALKTLEIMERDHLVERTAKLGKKALNRMKKWVDQFEIVGEARGLGLLLGASIISKETGKPDKDVALAIYREAMKNGAWIISDDEPNIRIYPALTIHDDLLDKGLTMVEEAISKVEREYVQYEYPGFPGVE